MTIKKKYIQIRVTISLKVHKNKAIYQKKIYKLLPIDKTGGLLDFTCE